MILKLAIHNRKIVLKVSNCGAGSFSLLIAEHVGQVKELEEAFKSVNKALQEAEAGLEIVQTLPSADLLRPVSLLFSRSGECRLQILSHKLTIMTPSSKQSACA